MRATCALFPAVGPAAGSRGRLSVRAGAQLGSCAARQFSGPSSGMPRSIASPRGRVPAAAGPEFRCPVGPPPDAACDHAPVLGQIDTDHAHLDAENSRGERHGKALLDHREEAGELLILAVGVDGGLFDQRLQRGWVPGAHGLTVALRLTVEDRCVLQRRIRRGAVAGSQARARGCQRVTSPGRVRW